MSQPRTHGLDRYTQHNSLSAEWDVLHFAQGTKPLRRGLGKSFVFLRLTESPTSARPGINLSKGAQEEEVLRRGSLHPGIAARRAGAWVAASEGRLKAHRQRGAALGGPLAVHLRLRPGPQTSTALELSIHAAQGKRAEMLSFTKWIMTARLRLLNALLI